MKYILFLIGLLCANQALAQGLLPSCGDQMHFLTHDPMSPEDVNNVTPLGITNGDGHILPTHINYFNGWYSNDSPVKIDVPVFSPGDLRVTAIEWEISGGQDDWHINFRRCNELRFYMHHLTHIYHHDLTARAREIKNGINAWCDDPNNPSYCAGLVNINVGAGEVLGTTISFSNAGVNFVAMDDRFPINFSNPDRYQLHFAELPPPLDTMSQDLYNEIEPSRLNTACTLDYFIPEKRNFWQTKLANVNGGHVPSTNTPVCGRMNWEIAGTAQGAWFLASEEKKAWFLEGEKVAVSMIKDNVTPSINVFALGKTAIPNYAEDSALTFIPDDSSTDVNQRFENTTAVGATYCWKDLMVNQNGKDPEFWPNYEPFPIDGIILVRRDADDTITIEYKEEETDCTAATKTFTEDAVKMER